MLKCFQWLLNQSSRHPLAATRATLKFQGFSTNGNINSCKSQPQTFEKTKLYHLGTRGKHTHKQGAPEVTKNSILLKGKGKCTIKQTNNFKQIVLGKTK